MTKKKIPPVLAPPQSVDETVPQNAAGTGPQRHSPADTSEPPSTLVHPRAGKGRKGRGEVDETLHQEEARQETREEVVVDGQSRVTTAGQKKGSGRWRLGDVLLNLYEVTSILGEGGMGTVYKVRHRGWEVDLAVKSPLPEIIEVEGGADSFEQEAETWVNLGLHPHIVSCFYVRRIGGIPRVFAEYVDGGTLSQWISEGKLTRLDRILDLAIQFAWGLQYAHEQNVVHQDVKPANVMVTAEGVAKITDFGLSKACARAGVPDSAAAKGEAASLVSVGGMTPAYCSPEQYEHQPLSARTDTWSWAVSILEMFVGEVTWRSGIAASGALKGYLQQGPVKPGLPRMPEALIPLLRQCFCEAPSERPQSMGDIADRLTGVYRETTGRTHARRKPEAGRDTSDSLNNRAVSFLDLGRAHEAAQLWRQAQTRQAHHIETGYNQALHGWRAGMSTDSEVLHRMEVLNRMEEVRRTRAFAVRCHHLLGRLRLGFADYAAAVSYLNQASSSPSPSPEIIKEQGLALCALAMRRESPDLWGEARDCLGRILHLKQSDPLVVLGYALARKKLGEVEEAEVFFANARQGLPHLQASLDEAVGFYLPGSETLRTWQVSGECTQAVGISADGRWGVALCDSRHLRRWDLETGKLLKSSFEGLENARTMALSSDGRLAVIAMHQRSLQLWDVQEGRRICPLQRHQGNMECLAISRNGHFAIGGSSDRLVRLWDLRRAGEPSDDKSLQACRMVHELKGHKGAITAVAIDGDGRQGLSGSRDGALRHWDLHTGACLQEMSGPSGAITAAALGFDGHTALSGSEDGSVCLWDLATGSCMREYRGHTQKVSAVGFKRDGCVAVSASADGSLRRWQIKEGIPSIVTRFDDPIYGAALADVKDRALLIHGNFLSVVRPFARQPYSLPYVVSRPVSALELEERAGEYQEKLNLAWQRFRAQEYAEALSLLSEARATKGFSQAAEALELWRKLAGRFARQTLRTAWEETPNKGHGAPITSLAVSPDSALLLAGCDDGMLHLWDNHTGRHLKAFQAHSRAVTAVLFSNTRNHAVSSCRDHVFFLWDLRTGKNSRCYAGHTDYVASVSMSPNGEYLLSASADTTLRLWDLKSERCLLVLKGHDSTVCTCAFSPDGRLALSGSWDNSIRLWDLKTGKSIGTLSGHTQTVTGVAMSQNGAFACSVSKDRTLVLWDLRTGECLHTFDGHADDVTSVALSPDDRFCLTGSKDKTVRVWDLGENVCLRAMEGHTGAVTSAIFSADANLVFSGGMDATLRTWVMDWQPEVREGTGWSERVRPYLEAFLSRRLGDPLRSSAIPSQPLAPGDYQDLREELGRRGFGWLDPKPLKRRIEAMMSQWTGETTAAREILESASRKSPAGRLKRLGLGRLRKPR